MSDLRKVLKAGLMVSASLIAIGCSDDESSAAGNPAGGNSTGGNTGANTGGNTTPLTAQNPAVEIKSGDLISALTKEGTPIAKLKDDASVVDGAIDVFANLGISGASGTASGYTAAAVTLLNSDAKHALKLDAAKNKAVASLAIDGKSAKDFTKVVLNDNFSADILLLENGTLTSEKAGGSTIEVKTAYVGPNAAIGRATVTDGETNSSALALEKGSKQKSHSSSTKHTHKKDAKSHAKTKPSKHAHKDGGTSDLTIKVVGVTAEEDKKFNTLKMATPNPLGALDLGNYASSVELAGGVVTPTRAASGFLVSHPNKDLETSDTEHKKKSLSLELALEKGKSKPKSSSSKKHKDSKKTHDSKSSKKGHRTSQTLVKKSSGDHHFMFQLDPLEKYSEVGDLKVIGKGSEIQAIKHQPLVVHELELETDLGVRVFAEKGEFFKLSGSTWDAVAKDSGARWAHDGQGQKMIDALKASVDKDGKSPIHFSEILEEDEASKTVTQYEHFDDHTNFNLYLVGDSKKQKIGTHKLVLDAMDLHEKDVFVEGVHFLPFAKDFAGVLPYSTGSEAIVLAIPHASDASDHVPHETLQVSKWAFVHNNFNDVVLFIDVAKKANTSALALGSGAVERALMSSKAQGGHSVLASTLDAVTAQLNPTNLVESSFANLSTARVNQAAQVASLTRGVAASSATSLGALDQYNVTFDHNGAQFGFVYSTEGGNAFSGGKGSTSLGANLATKIGGLTAVTSFEASADAGNNSLTSSTHASYQAAVTLAKAYNAGGLSVVPMAGLGIASAALNDYSAAVPMAAGTLGLHMDDVTFNAATFNAGVSVALDGFTAETTGVSAAMTFGVAGYLASTTNAKLGTSEGYSADLQLGGSSVAPYAQFNVGFATGESLNALFSTGSAAVNFSVER